MSRTIKTVFELMGILLISLILWWFIVGDDVHISLVKKQVWSASTKYYEKEWAYRTGNDGTDTKNLTQESWEKAHDFSNN